MEIPPILFYWSAYLVIVLGLFAGLMWWRIKKRPGRHPLGDDVKLRRQAGEHKPEDVHPMLLAQISHFFEHYKDLESGKWVKLEGWVGIDDARAEILAGVERYRNAADKPAF